jgi:hypothetical protein
MDPISLFFLVAEPTLRISADTYHDSEGTQGLLERVIQKLSASCPYVKLEIEAGVKTGNPPPEPSETNLQKLVLILERNKAIASRQLDDMFVKEHTKGITMFDLRDDTDARRRIMLEPVDQVEGFLSENNASDYPSEGLKGMSHKWLRVTDHQGNGPIWIDILGPRLMKQRWSMALCLDASSLHAF